MTNVKKAKKTLDALIRVGHTWSDVFDRVVSGFRLTEAEKQGLRAEYERKR